jgi:hypothetical protein
MPKDAKFGLILGIGLVILIAVLFFRKDQDRPGHPPTSPPVSASSSVPVSAVTGSPDHNTSTASAVQTGSIKREINNQSPVLYSVAPVAEK